MTVKRITEILTLAVFLLVIFGFSIAFLLLPDREFSEQENRSLRTFPELTLEKLASGRFAEEINDYFADQFPLRDPLVGVKGTASDLLIIVVRSLLRLRKPSMFIRAFIASGLASKRFSVSLSTFTSKADSQRFANKVADVPASAISRIS